MTKKIMIVDDDPAITRYLEAISGLSGRKHSIPKAEGFFAKPFDTNEVLEKVKEVLNP
ncbi:MAG: hypothetical protein LC660_17000 [Desulfobacteraceae bacterium]|nr:hypothetical protein [Desulfobacteraceae bacterium]